MLIPIFSNVCSYLADADITHDLIHAYESVRHPSPPCKSRELQHYDDVIMSTMASQITNLTIVYSTVYSDADQRKHQSSASLAFVWGIHRGPVNSPHKWPVTRKMFPFDDVIMRQAYMHWQWPRGDENIPSTTTQRSFSQEHTENMLTGTTASLTLPGLILSLRPANERRRYKVKPSLIGWAQRLESALITTCGNHKKG